jgi:formate hydrogenlyase subunit 3/multisubunit Na+/H+ antiporter MnhD subunit
LKVEPTSEEVARKYLGGKGYAVYLLYKYLKEYEKAGISPKDIDALGPENVLIFATGPGTGVPGFPSSGRYHVMALKSPLTGSIGSANSGGEFGPFLKFSGFDAVVIEGASDAYTAAPASSSAFLSALVDQASYYVLLRVLIYILTPPTVLPWTFMFAVLSALTMIVGNLLALTEKNVKRLIAYICIADVGYNLVAITSVTPLGIMGNLFFFFAGGITTALAFMAVGIFNGMRFESLEDFSGVGRRMPLTSLALIVAVFSFIGVPAFAGFMAKYLVFTSAIEANMSWLAVIGVLTSVIQAAYLLRLINYMYAKKPKEESKIKEPRKLLIPIFILAIAIVILGVYPNIILSLIEPVIQQFQTIPKI